VKEAGAEVIERDPHTVGGETPQLPERRPAEVVSEDTVVGSGDALRSEAFANGPSDGP
jgi:hypothetical protein